MFKKFDRMVYWLFKHVKNEYNYCFYILLLREKTILQIRNEVLTAPHTTRSVFVVTAPVKYLLVTWYG